MIRKLRRKFIYVNMVIVTTMLLVIFGMVLHFTKENLRQQSLDMLQTITDSRKHPFSSRDALLDVPLPYFYVSVNFLGDVSAAAKGYYDLSDPAMVESVIQAALEKKEPVGLLPEYDLRYQRSLAPFGQTLVFLDVSSELSTMGSLLRSCAVICLLSLSAFFGLSILLARWAIRPVETAWNQQRQFVADASHELKTPLTVILTNAELLQSPDYDDRQRGQFAASILTMTHQMRGLVESLLELARVDNGTATISFSQVDLSELIQEGLLPFEPVYFEKGLTLESRIQEGIWVRGSQAHLRQVLDILLDNAAKYTAPGGCVTLTFQRRGSHCLLEVANPGPEISREDLKNIFKRFYRIDKARAMNHSYGLGLSIAQSIAEGHGGKIWAESSGGYNRFYLQLSIL